MIHEPFKTQDGRWRLSCDESKEVILFATSEEAYAFYHRFKNISDTPQILPLTTLHAYIPPPVQGVREDQSLVTPPYLTPEQQEQAYAELTKAEVARLEYEKALAGKIPLRYQLRGLLAGGIGGILLGVGMAMFRGC